MFGNLLKMIKQIKNISNQKWNHLTAIKFIKRDKYSHQIWLWECDCGNQKEIVKNNVIYGTAKACGCKENLGKHNLYKHPLYSVWHDIKKRCYNIKNKSYHNYGGRGITICDEWKNNPEIFIKWGIENGYKKGLEIDRIDNSDNKKYSPTNCRFVTRKQNSNNRRTNKRK